MHALDVLDGYPEPGGGIVKIHADDPTGRWASSTAPTARAKHPAARASPSSVDLVLPHELEDAYSL
ncbi:hypothetical protein Misp03_72340 [Microbispora sp. NBRC 16548]|nr:hypothetical protein Misp03_72340 [Microbispora sp. NBRC 16548]